MLLRKFAPVQEPAIALFRPAPNMRNGVDPAAIDQAQRSDRKARIHRHAVRPIPVQHQRRLAVQLCAGLHQHGHRHLLTVRRRGIQALRHVIGRIMPGRNDLRLQQDLFARLHIIAKRLGRRCRRRIGIADNVGVIFVAAARPQAVGFLINIDLVRTQVRLACNHDARIGVFALRADQVPLRRLSARNIDAGTVRHEVLPRCPRRYIRRRRHDLEVDRLIGIGMDDEPVAPMIDTILQARLSRLHAHRHGRWIRRGDQPRFAGLMVPGPDQYMLVRTQRAQAQEKTLILFVIDQHVSTAARRPAIHLGRA